MSKYHVTLKYSLNVAGIAHSAELWIPVNAATSEAENQYVLGRVLEKFPSASNITILKEKEIKHV